MLSSLPKIDLNPVVETAKEVVEETQDTKSVGLTSPLMIGIIVGIIVVIIVAIVLVKQLKKRKKSTPVKHEEVRQTEFCEKPEVVYHSGKTMHLWGAGADSAKQMYIYLSDLQEEKRIFRAPITTSITIGRKEGDIIITDDTSLSRQHCKIIKRGSSYYVEDLNSANGTRYEGYLVTGEMPIIPGGILTIGRHSMKVEMIED